MSLQDQLRNYQSLRQLCQTQMAEKLGISQGTYNKWINKRQEIPPKYYTQIAEVLNLPLKDIVPKEMRVNFTLPSGEVSPSVNALKLYERFVKHLEERIAYQIKENIRLQEQINVLQEVKGLNGASKLN